MGKVWLSILVLIITVAASVIGYIWVVKNYADGGWFNFAMFLALITFVLGFGVFISALLIEKSVKALK